MNTEHDEQQRGQTKTADTPADDPAPSNGANGPAAPDRSGAAEDPATPERPRRGGGFLSLLLSLAALALAAWTWWQVQTASDSGQERVYAEIARLDSGDSELRLSVKEVRDALDALAAGDVTEEFRAVRQRMESDREMLTRLEQTIREQQALSRSLQVATERMQGRLQAAEAAVTGMSTRELDAGGELDLAEVDYLLRLANERLLLFADPAAADDALDVADRHLAALENPLYAGVRQDIAAARRALASVEMPDYAALAERLDDLQRSIPVLTFRGDEAVASPEAEPASDADQGWWEKASGALSGLVTVRRATGEDERLGLEDKDYVRQRIWLQVEIAHLALMRRDEAAFRAALDRAAESIATWFVAEDDAFNAVVGEIDALRAINVEPDVPDISAPLATLRILRDAGAVATPPPAAEEPAPVVEDDPAAGAEQG